MSHHFSAVALSIHWQRCGYCSSGQFLFARDEYACPIKASYSFNYIKLDCRISSLRKVMGSNMSGVQRFHSLFLSTKFEVGGGGGGGLELNS